MYVSTVAFTDDAPGPHDEACMHLWYLSDNTDGDHGIGVDRTVLRQTKVSTVSSTLLVLLGNGEEHTKQPGCAEAPW